MGNTVKIILIAIIALSAATVIFAYDQSGEYDFEGPVGIGTTDPTERLEIATTSSNNCLIRLNAGTGKEPGLLFARLNTNFWEFYCGGSDRKLYFYDYLAGVNMLTLDSGQNPVKIKGTDNAYINIGSTGANTKDRGIKFLNQAGTGVAGLITVIPNTVGTDAIMNFYVGGGSAANDRHMVILDNGNVGIGLGEDLPNDGRLVVNGKIVSSEIRVTASPSDFVFAKNYRLRPLEEVDRYVKKHSHLPEIPSAKAQIASGGVELGVMQSKMLQKIEEITLYLIEVKKENEALKNRIAVLERK